jgi:hypothetical protein
VADADDYSSRTKVWLVVGNLVALGVGWLVASLNHWTGLISGARPPIVLLVAAPYWLIAMFVHDVLIPAWRGHAPKPPAPGRHKSRSSRSSR